MAPGYICKKRSRYPISARGPWGYYTNILLLGKTNLKNQIEFEIIFSRWRSRNGCLLVSASIFILLITTSFTDCHGDDPGIQSKLRRCIKSYFINTLDCNLNPKCCLLLKKTSKLKSLNFEDQNSVNLRRRQFDSIYSRSGHYHYS